MTELFTEFQEFRKILCICPHCGEIVRVSDLKLITKGAIVRTWLDEFDDEVTGLVKKEIVFEKKEAELRALSVEKGRKAAEKQVNRMITPAMKSFKLDPFDIKPISNPVDFVVFKGMTKRDEISDIMLLSKFVKNPELNALRQQVNKAILSNKYDWQVARVDDEGKIKFE